MSKYYQSNDKVYEFTDEQAALKNFPDYVPTGAAEITEAQADAIRNPPLTLTQAQALQAQAIAVACRTAIYAGFTSSALGAAYTYPASDTDQRNLIAQVTSSLLPNLPSGWTAPFWCADSTGAWAMRAHTAAQIQKAGQDGQAAITALRTQAAKLTAEIEAATTVAAVQAVTWAAP